VKRILDDLPFYDDEQVFYLQPSPQYVRILPRQIPLRISLGVYLPDVEDHTPTRSSFPAVLDTGFNGGLALSTLHLREWAGLNSGILGSEVRPGPHQRPLTAQGFPARAFESRFFIRPNQRRSWDAADDSPVEISGTILLVNAPADGLRVPLLGMSALEKLGRKLTIDYRRRLVQL
jgi:hypothetical protein